MLYLYSSVGKNISTKKPDGRPYNGEASVWRGYGEKYRLDVTSEYKYPEGSLEERLAVQNADNEAKGGRDVFATGDTMVCSPQGCFVFLEQVLMKHALPQNHIFSSKFDDVYLVLLK